eukprot:m.137941 g.137941  ORF g.137941 m.137941 type:complete len:356 (+) comp14766_c0_seq17:78-1145(+)
MEEEVEALSDIYEEGLQSTIDSGSGLCVVAIEIKVELTELVLELCCSKDYPETIPTIRYRDVKGVDDDFLEELRVKIGELAEELQGDAMLYSLAELAKEEVESYLPATCTLCYCPFEKKEDVFRTDCFHFFHKSCAVRLRDICKGSDLPEWISGESSGKAQFSSVPCPLCRTPITLIDLEKLAASQDETNDVEEFVFTEEIRQAQRERSQVYERQKAQGGLVPKKGENEVVFVLESRFDSEGREIQRAPRPAPPEQRAVRDDDAIRSQGSRKDARNGNPGPEHGMKLKGNHHKQKTKTSRNPDSQIEPLVSEGGGGGGRGRARGRGRGRQGNRGRGRGGRAGRKDGATGTAPQEA